MGGFIGTARVALLSAVAVVGLAGSVAAQQIGSFTDSRDGQKYKTVVIGGKTWMAENMNVKTGVSWCYDDDESNCKKYGRLYAWSTAAKMVCPSGWHLPSRQEWDNLTKAAGGEKTAGKKLKAEAVGTITVTVRIVSVFRPCPAGFGPPTTISAVSANTATGGRLRRTIAATLTAGSCTMSTVTCSSSTATRVPAFRCVASKTTDLR